MTGLESPAILGALLFSGVDTRSPSPSTSMMLVFKRTRDAQHGGVPVRPSCVRLRAPDIPDSGHILVPQSGQREAPEEQGLRQGGPEMVFSTREPGGLDKLADVTQEIREFVRNPGTDDPLMADGLASLLQRVAGASMREIDSLIAALQMLREKLQNDETRVQRAIAEYTTLSQSTLHSTKVISECLANWKQSSRRPEHGTVSTD
jgi:hypothetical protein